MAFAVIGGKLKKVAIIQSNYIPWKGYFDIINDVDLFIFLDQVQYTNRDWRSRNKIKNHNGVIWLSIPIGSNRDKMICEILLPKGNWAIEQWKSIQHSYAKAPYFKKYKAFFEHIYCEKEFCTLSEFNQYLIKTISSELLGIQTQFKDSRDFHAEGKKLDLILDLAQKADAEIYISGPAASDYIDPKKFLDADIKLVYKDYSYYPEYPQQYPPFDHYISIIDLLFSVGPDAPYYIWGWRV